MATEIKISEVIQLLKQGYSRYQKHEVEEGKSIQRHFGIRGAQLKQVLNHPRVKGIKRGPRAITIVDDVTVRNETTNSNVTTNNSSTTNLIDIFS